MQALVDSHIAFGRELEPLEALAEPDYMDIQRQAKDLIASWEPALAPEILRPERRDNARTALFEALTANGHLSQVEIHGGSVDEIHDQVLARLLNGYSHDLPTHEKWRRFYEICEELYIHETHQKVIKGELPPTTSVGIVTDFPEMMQAAEQQGYRSENKKGFVRSSHLVQHDDGTFTRVIESVSRSNSGPDSTFRLLEDFGKEPDTSIQPDLAALKTPFSYDLADMHDGVVELQRRLDVYSGVNIRYGEVAQNDQIPYVRLREESKLREEQVECYVDRLADFEQRLDFLLAEGKITQEERDGQYKHEVRQILRAICTFRPQYAEGCFGKEAAQNYVRAADFEVIGDERQRDFWLARAHQLEKEVLFCGVKIETDKAKQLGVELSDTSDLISQGKESWKWTEGKCRMQQCPNKNRTVKVGPCNICRDCQKLFDSGKVK